MRLANEAVVGRVAYCDFQVGVDRILAHQVLGRVEDANARVAGKRRGYAVDLNVVSRTASCQPTPTTAATVGIPRHPIPHILTARGYVEEEPAGKGDGLYFSGTIAKRHQPRSEYRRRHVGREVGGEISRGAGDGAFQL